MSAPSHKFKVTVNLLRPQGLPEKLPVKFLKWLLSYGRYIVVAVEILVLTTFAARFGLDARLADLKEEINQQVPYIESFSQTENLIRQTQFKLASFQKIRTQTPNFPNALNKIRANTPDGVIFESFILEKTTAGVNIQFRITGQANSNNSLSFFINNLKKDQQLSNINLTSITLDQGVTRFSLTGVIK